MNRWVSVAVEELKSRETIAKLGFGAVATYATWLFGGLDQLIIILLNIMLADYVTGLASAAYNKQLDSTVGFKGLIKKGMMLVLVIVGNWFDKLLGMTSFTASLPILADSGRNLACFFLIGNELLSILENLGECNVPVPKWLISMVAKLKDKADGGEKVTP